MIFKLITSLFTLAIIFFSCKVKNDFPHWEIVTIEGKRFNKMTFSNRNSVLCDSNYQIINLISQIGDSLTGKYYFNKDGILIAKEQVNNNQELHGKNYYFHENGNLKSIITYQDGKKVDFGFDYYENTGNLQNYIFYDSMGIYYYAEHYSDTSTEVQNTFNPNNPNSYLLIKTKIPDPQRSNLLKMMENIGLDSLNQIH